MTQATSAHKRPAAKGRRSSRDEIRNAFTRRVAELGYDGTNFGAIADELGISKGTIVHHFGTKEKLFADAHEQYMERRLAEAHAIVDSLPSPDQQMAGLVWAFSMYQTYGRTETVAFQREIIRFNDAESMRHSKDLRDEYLDLINRVLQSGIDAGLFREGPAAIWALQIFGGTQWMWTWFNPDGQIANDTVAQAYVALILRGLMREPERVDELADIDGPVRVAVYAVLDAGAE